MKLKKIASLCSQAGQFYLQDRQTAGEPEQWLGDGYAAYPISGLPYLEIDNICTMFDIPEKKQEKLIMRQVNAPESINWEDTDPTERQLVDSIMHLRYEGRELLPLRTSAGIVFIQEKYLAPLDDTDYMRLYERRNGDGGIYIVAKIGMVIQAVITPVDVVSEDLIQQMEELTDLCRTALLKKEQMYAPQNREESDKDQRTLFKVDKSTGEVLEE